MKTGTWSAVEACDICHRVRQSIPPGEGDPHDVCLARVAGGEVYYVHSYYGCDTGCCGHRLIIASASGEEVVSEFRFTHDRAEMDEWAGEMAAKLGLRVGECEYVDD